MNSQDVAIVPTCAECGERWLPSDPERWRAVFLDEGPDDRPDDARSRPDGFVIGFPVRPSDDDEQDEQLPAESDSQQG